MKKNIDIIKERIEDAETLKDIDKIIEEIHKIVLSEVSLDEAMQIDDLLSVVRKKALSVKVER